MRTNPIDATQDTHNAVVRRRRRRRRLVAGLAVTTLCAAVGQAPAGAAQTDARIRLAHFSSDAPTQDVYLVGFDGEEQRLLNGLGFGEVTDYTALEAGNYTFLLRRSGSPADADPWVTASAELEEGGAYTFAAMGPNDELKQALLTDDLTPPPAGQAKVRLIQASSTAGEVDVSAGNGAVLAEGAAFGSTTEYAAVAAGPHTVEVMATGGGRVVRQLDLDAGTVNSLVVLEGSGEQPFELTSIVDATGVDVSAEGPMGATQAAPLGGVATGAGGAANAIGDGDQGGLGTPALTALAIALATAVVVGSTRLAEAGGPHTPARRRAGRHFGNGRRPTELTSSRRSA